MTQTICLNMIVKDESHIITETLTKLTNKIKFDYYVICDTGSSDNTKKYINYIIMIWMINWIFGNIKITSKRIN